MGFSVSASFVVIMLVAVAALGGLYVTATNSTESITDAGSANLQQQLDQLDTDVVIEAAEWDGTQFVIELRNVGATELSVNRTDLLIDGQFVARSAYEARIDGESTSDVWLPGQRLRIVLPTSRPDRLVVVTEHGVSRFQIPRTAPRAGLWSERIAFTNGDALRSLKQGTPVVDSYDVTDAVVAGPIAHGFGSDPADELPFVDSESAQHLGIANATGGQSTLTDAARNTQTRLAVGTWQGGERSVFYADADTGDIRRVTAGGSDSAVATVDANGIAGIADFDNDSADELVWGGTSLLDLANSINYIDDDGTEQNTGVSYGIGTDGIGLGEPADFDDADETPRVPFVDGTNDVLLADHDGNTEPVTTGGVAATSPMASVDWDGDDATEIVFVNTSGNLRYVDNVTATNDLHTVVDADGNAITADLDAGVT